MDKESKWRVSFVVCNSLSEHRTCMWCFCCPSRTSAQSPSSRMSSRTLLVVQDLAPLRCVGMDSRRYLTPRYMHDPSSPAKMYGVAGTVADISKCQSSVFDPPACHWSRWNTWTTLSAASHRATPLSPCQEPCSLCCSTSSSFQTSTTPTHSSTRYVHSCLSIL